MPASAAAAAADVAVFAVPCSAVQCRAVPCSALQCRAVPCSAVQCRALPCSAIITTTCLISATKPLSGDHHVYRHQKKTDTKNFFCARKLIIFMKITFVTSRVRVRACRSIFLPLIYFLRSFVRSSFILSSIRCGF